MGSVVVEGATVDDGIAIVAFITEDVRAETVPLSHWSQPH